MAANSETIVDSKNKLEKKNDKDKSLKNKEQFFNEISENILKRKLIGDKLIQFVVDNIQFINVRDDALQQQTPLMMACEAGYEELIEILLDYGADPNMVSQNGLCHYEITRYARSQLDVTFEDIYFGANDLVPYSALRRGFGVTPLIYAATSRTLAFTEFSTFNDSRRAKKIVQTLLERGATPDYPMGSHKNAIDWLNSESESISLERNEKELIIEELSTNPNFCCAEENLLELQKKLIAVNQEFLNSTFANGVMNIIVEYARPSPISNYFPSLQTLHKKLNVVIHVVASKTKLLGDRYHVIALRDSLSNTYRTKPIVFEWDTDVDDVKQLSEKLAVKVQEKENQNKTHIVMGVGEKGLEYLPLLKQDKRIVDKMITIWSGHQYLPQLEMVKDVLDIIGLPEYEALKLQHPRIISCHGVPHDATPENLRQKYEQFEKEFDTNKPALGIMLGGDAPDSMNQIKQFTPECAKKLGNFIGTKYGYIRNESGIGYQYNEKLMIYVTSGPRTSKEALDEFIQGLVSSGIKLTNFKILNFEQYKGASLGLLEFMRRHPNICEGLIVTGDSITMGTAAIEILPVGKVTLAVIDSMSNSHNNFNANMCQLGYAHTIDKDSSFKFSEIAKMTPKNPIKVWKAADLLGNQLRSKIDIICTQKTIKSDKLLRKEEDVILDAPKSNLLAHPSKKT